MASIDSKTRKRLEEQWLPRVRELERRRRPIFRLLVAILLIPLVLAILLVANQIFILKDIDGFQSTLSSFFIGLSAFTFVYLGKLQKCNDVLVIVEGTVYLGDRDAILEAMSNLSCLGGFREIFEDVKKIL